MNWQRPGELAAERIMHFIKKEFFYPDGRTEWRWVNQDCSFWVAVDDWHPCTREEQAAMVRDALLATAPSR